MGDMAQRPAYVRKGEVRVEDARRNTDEITGSMLAEMDAALTAWEASRRAGQRRQSPAPAARGWHRPWIQKQRQPLWLLLAKAELAACLEDGKASRAIVSTEGWHLQIGDGEKLGFVPLA
jgi:hypothetical protein